MNGQPSSDRIKAGLQKLVDIMTNLDRPQFEPILIRLTDEYEAALEREKRGCPIERARALLG